MAALSENVRKILELREFRRHIRYIAEDDCISASWVVQFFKKDNQIICIGDKSLLNVDFLVDDCLDNLKGGKFIPIVLDAPYNRDSDYLRAKDLKEVYELIKEIEHA